MNIRQWIVPILLSLATYFLAVSAVRLYTYYRSGSVDQSSFVAPSSQVAYEPLCKVVEIAPRSHGYSEDCIVVTTDYGAVTIDSLGAVISSMEYIRKTKTGDVNFITLASVKNEQILQGAFLVAQEGKTALQYELIDTKDTDAAMSLTYKVHSETGIIEKIFTIDKHLCKINVKITAIPAHEKTMKLRVMWPSPEMGEIVEGDYCGAVLIDKKGSFVKKQLKYLDDQVGYFKPRMFGSDNKYFVHALVGDENNFVTRAYYSIDNGKVTSIIESASIAQQTSWSLNFYMGPKDIHAMHLVSPLLEKTLDYGMFSFFTKMLLYALEVCYDFLGNFGWAIIALTLLLKLVLLPFTLRSDAVMKRVKDQQKQLAFVEQKFKHDPKALVAAREKLMRENGLATMGGCLPMLIQPIIFMSLSGALNGSIALHKAPFIGWIKDLSRPDDHYVLPALLFIAMLTSFLMNAEKLDAKKTIGITLAVLVGVAFIGTVMSAGLALFICVSMLLHIAQTFLQKVYKYDR